MSAITTVEAEAVQTQVGSLAANPKVTTVQDRGEEDSTTGSGSRIQSITGSLAFKSQ